MGRNEIENFLTNQPNRKEGRKVSIDCTNNNPVNSIKETVFFQNENKLRILGKKINKSFNFLTKVIITA